MRQAQEKKRERKKCRKDGSAVDPGLGHEANSRVTVIRENGWGAIGLKVSFNYAFISPVGAYTPTGFFISSQ